MERNYLKSNLYKKDIILSGKELFKYRKQNDKSLPNVGGSKDFAPDDTWLQAKKLEKFYEERLELLSEQRVERLGNLVTGDWNPEKKLVELHKELGKFWTYMGFVDKSRKWLHPEEALYLMETNTLEVKYKGLPLSIQHAYRCFFCTDIILEQYQVYSHLRRLGYAVIRHQGRFDITEYERKLKLDQHIKVKRNKTRKRKTDKDDKLQDAKKMKENPISIDSINGSNMFVDKQEQSCEDESMDISDEYSEGKDTDQNLRKSTCKTDNLLGQRKAEDCISSEKVQTLQPCVFGQMETETFSIPEKGECDKLTLNEEYVSYNLKYSRITSDSDFSQSVGSLINKTSKFHQTTWDFSKILFPNIANKETLQIAIFDKSTELFPPGVQAPDHFTFDIEDYYKKFPANQRSENDEDTDLEFSFCTSYLKNKKINAKNWTEYKEKLLKLESSPEEFLYTSPVSHLWKGDVKPLVKPCDAVHTERILEKLQIISSYGEHKKAVNLSDVKHKVVYDIYLPDSKFKKSSPGLPHHRLCVIRHSEPLPDLETLTLLTRYYTDSIPIHWAVVDHGDIAFYSFTDHQIPTIL